MCGGGGSGSVGPPPSPARIRELVSSSQGEQDQATHKIHVADFLSEVLQEANVRDADAVNRHLETARGAIEGQMGDAVDLRFGGSVRRHTYVDGLSDVDLLVVLNRDVAAEASPRELLTEFAAALRGRLPDTDIEVGDISVKVHFRDGTDLQLLPAFRIGGGYKIPRRYGETWSGVIKPREFATSLTEVNQSNARKVVPVIKLFKIAQLRFPQSAQLTGYHAEAIAVEAFKEYRGPLDLREMFLHYCRSAAARVASPMQETTGQSTYIDSYLGPANSSARAAAATRITHLATRLQNADDRCAVESWEDAFSG